MQEGDEISMMTRIEIDRIKEEYPPGSHVKLIEMKGEPHMPYGLNGTVMAIDDIGQIHVNWENGSTLALTEEDRFEKMRMVRVIVCRPGEKPTKEEIGDDLASMQAVVGGMIEEYQPFYDESDPRIENVTIYCHEEGKLRNLERNRAIADPDGRILDIIRGPFFICYATIESETFHSLPEDLEEKFMKRFEWPEHFVDTPGGAFSIPYDPQKPARQEVLSR